MITDAQIEAAKREVRQALARLAYETSRDRFMDSEAMDVIVRVALEATEAMRWQPIETAPKDGLPVLLLMPEPAHHSVSNWDEESTPRLVSIGRWNKSTYGFGVGGWIVLEVSRERDRYDGGYAECRGVHPTHWQHMPA